MIANGLVRQGGARCTLIWGQSEFGATLREKEDLLIIEIELAVIAAALIWLALMVSFLPTYRAAVA
jgi:hypothetical protein